MEVSNGWLIPFLETERLVLRPMTEEDAEQVVKWRNSRHISEMTFQASGVLFTVEKHLDWFRSTRSSRLDYIIEIKNSSNPIGSLSFSFVDLKRLGVCGEIGKYIGEEECLGKGYASEAVSRWIDYGFYDMGLECVVSRTRANNLANIRVNKKLGFSVRPWPEEFGSVTEEWCFMCLTREDWVGGSKGDIRG